MNTVADRSARVVLVALALVRMLAGPGGGGGLAGWCDAGAGVGCR
jgi:hypothetical protein